MMKKKNIAMAMAATMVAGTVAPVMAADHEINSDKVNSLITNLKGLLRKTYIEEGKSLEESIYQITVSTGGSVVATADTLTEIVDIEDVLMNASKLNQVAEVKVVKKAVTELANGDIIKEEIPKYETNTEVKELGEFLDGTSAVDRTSGHVTGASSYDYDTNKTKVVLSVEYGITTGSTTAAKIIEELNNKVEGISVTSIETAGGGNVTTAAITKELEIKVGDYKITTHAATNGNDYSVVLKNGQTKALKDITAVAKNNTATVDEYKAEIEKLIAELSKIDKMQSADAVSNTTTDIATIIVNPHEKLEIVEAKDLLNNGVLTAKGQELVRAINTTYDRTSGSGVSTYTVKVKSVGVVDSETVEGKKNYFVNLEIEGVAVQNSLVKEELAKIKIESADRNEVIAVREMLLDLMANQPLKVVDEISGETRFETAIEISKQTVTNPTTSVRDEIVLVGENAIVDGLSAGPLAASLNTSILLTGKDSVKANVIDEIERVLNIENTSVGNLKTKTIYVVGGEAVIGQKVIDQLKGLGVNVERVAGDDRYKTSMEIADLVLKNTSQASKTNAYVVGGYGLADAMSISAQASNDVKPILVVNKSELDKETVKTIAEDYNSLDIIGGNAVVSDEVEKQLTDAIGKSSVERVAGETREETNAKVITKYHRGANKVFVANNGFVKNIKAQGDDQLIDAMTVAPLAGKIGAPIVLTGEKLSEGQADAIELRISSEAQVSKVGGAVVKSVVEAIGKIVGIVK